MSAKYSAIALASALSLLLVASRTSANELDFVRDIRPILADKCYACHGPDQSKREANLRFDTLEGATADLGGYQAIVPGKPNESELVKRISANGDEAMPPVDHPKQLSPEEKQTLTKWIEQGAPWQAHWAYTTPVRHPAPNLSGEQPQATSFIDAFVLAKLQTNGLGLSPEADRRSLLRRLSFDLIGLPPTVDELRDFEDDHSADAYESQVDRLLRSPHFGERLAIYWLDLVRYADTVGYHGDQDVSISPYRDYVINAFNDNMPFDQFTREQLAGDLLDKPTQWQQVASGYNRLGMMSAEGGVQPEEYLAKYAADRVRNASTVWMGSTLGCAECHDHKFDPFTSKDFYRFAAFFADITERGLYSGANRDGNWGPFVKVADVGFEEQAAPIRSRIAELQTLVSTTTSSLDSSREIWEQAQRQLLKHWQSLVPSTAKARHKTKLTIDSEGRVLASGANPDQNTYTLEFDQNLESIRAIRIDVLPHDSLPQQGPGRAGNGNFVISEIRAVAVTKAENESLHETPVHFANARATIEQLAGNDNPYGKWSALSAIDQDEKGSSWGWAILPESGKPNALILETSEPLTCDSLRLVIEQNHTNPKHTLGSFRISASSETPAAETQSLSIPAEIREALLAEQRTAEQTDALTQSYLRIAPELEPARRELAALEKQLSELEALHTRSSLVTVATEPREMRVLHRGNWMDKSGQVVLPGLPEFLAPNYLAQMDTPVRATRLDLANWLVSAENPLTARVFVNRLWKLLFGVGLSKVLDDVGSQGEAPSHPELLDSLAVEFVESGWDVKHMIKLMVMSQTYRQSSVAGDDLRSIDPYNRLLARQSRFRLDAEIIRDNALAVSGLLVHKLGGRSAKPYQPAGLYQHLNFPTREYQPDTGRDQYRRGVYTHWQRQFLHPAMQAFDAPAREECTAERPRSNTPLAALVLLNDPSYVEAARKFAERILTEGGAHRDDRLDWMMVQALSRPPTAMEKQILGNLIQSEQANYQANPAAAEELMRNGLSTPTPGIELSELAAWTAAARAVFNMHEMVTRN